MFDLLSCLIISNILFVFFSFIAVMNNGLNLQFEQISLYIFEVKTEFMKFIISLVGVCMNLY